MATIQGISTSQGLYQIKFGSEFLPTDISGCVGWWDASDTSTITLRSSTYVTQWNDKSGSGYNVAQTTESLQPTYNTADRNSLNTITFGGTQYFKSSSTVPLTTNFTWFACVSGGVASGSHRIVGHSFYSYVDLIRKNSQTSVASAVGDNEQGSYLVGSLPSAGFDYKVLVTSRTEDIGGFVAVNNTKLTATDAIWIGANLTGNQYLYIGSTETGLIPWKGNAVELIRYNSKLSDSDYTLVINYLANKWNLTI